MAEGIETEVLRPEHIRQWQLRNREKVKGYRAKFKLHAKVAKQVGSVPAGNTKARRVKKLILAAKQSEETSRACKPRLFNPFEFLDQTGY